MSKIVTALGFAAPEKSRRCSDDEEEEEETEENETETRTNDQFPRCVPFKSLNIEVAVYWEAAVGYLQDNDMDQLNVIQPELSIFCQYVERYCESIHFESDKWQQMKNQYVLLSLLEIVAKYNLGDEVGLGNLKILMSTMVTKYDFNELNIALIARILEAVYPIADNRLQAVVEIVNGILQIGDSSVTLDSEMESAVFKRADIELQLKLSALKVKMMDLKEQENGFVQRKDYASAQKATEEWDQANEEYIRLLHPLIVAEANQSSSTVLSDVNLLKAPQKVSSETILKCLQIMFYTICSEHTKKITPPVVNLYNKFICRHMDSGQVLVREWAFKCATACSMLYSMLAKEVCRTLCNQFVRNHNIRLWTVAIECLFELVDHYGLDFFAETPSEDDTVVGKRLERSKSRQLFSTSTRGEEHEAPQSLVEVLGHLSLLLENCEHSPIVQALVVGFCRFVLHGIYTEPKIVSKLMVYYFNPATEPEVNQLLGIFFEALTNERKQEYLQPALLPTLFVIFEAPIDHPLQEIKPETVIKFVIDVTQPQYCSPGLNIHDTIGMSFINAMLDNVTQKELLKVLSKGLLLLEVCEDPHFRKDLKNSCDQLLKVTGLDDKVIKNIMTFKDLLDEIRRPSLTFSSTRMTTSSGQAERVSDGEVSDAEVSDAEADKTDKGLNLEAISEVTEEQSSVIEGENSKVEETEQREEVEDLLTPESPSLGSGAESSVFLPETQKQTESEEVLQSQSSVDSNDSEVIEASFDESAMSKRRMRARTNVTASTSKSLASQTEKRTTRSVATPSVTKKRVMEVKTPNTRSKITRSVTSSQPERKEASKGKKETPKEVAKKQPEKPATRSRDKGRDKQSGKVEESKNMSLSQSSSASSVKSGPSTPKRHKSVAVMVTPLRKSFIESQTNPHRTRRAAAEEVAQQSIMTRTRTKHLSPGGSSQRSKSSQESKAGSTRSSSKTRSASAKK